jgi:hypothetical protein
MPLRALEIRDSYIPSSAGKAGNVEALRGRVVVLHRGTRQAYFAKAGDAVHENDVLFTLADSRCRIRFLSRDVASMAQDSEFSVDAFLDQRQEGKKAAVFSMMAGKIKFYALRLLFYKESSLTVKTPTAVIGVRGTRFGVHVYWEGGKKGADRQGRSYTDAHCTDGEIEVNGKPVPAGYIYRDRTGEVGPTDPGYLKGFDAETDVGEGGDKGAGGGTPSSSSPLMPSGQDPSGHADRIEKLLEPKFPEPVREAPREPPVGASGQPGPIEQGPSAPQEFRQPGNDSPTGGR